MFYQLTIITLLAIIIVLFTVLITKEKKQSSWKKEHREEINNLRKDMRIVQARESKRNLEKILN
jgi:preprotein translocase subunit YajC